MFRFIFIFLILTSPLAANTFLPNDLQEESLSLKIDLCEPTFAEGVLTTEKGGVIEGPDVRIQAQKIIYSKTSQSLIAEGSVILEFGEYYFIGDRLEFDFKTYEGTLHNGKTGLEPWFFGAEQILLHSDGSYTLYKGFLTTSETEDRDWEMTVDQAHLKDRQYLNASDITFRIRNIPVLWVPSLKTNLETIFDAPIRYSFKWGGRQGVRGIMVYELFSWNRFKTFFRLDYRIKRGFGGGLETYYRSEDRKEIFNTINYFANDNSLSNPHEKYRYRFQGLYHNLVLDRVSVDLTWDKLSDRDMATDYNDRGLELDTAERTLLLIRKQQENRIELFLSEVKVNRFQSVKQQLPTMEISFRPQSLKNTGVISTSLFKASYLDFSYSNNIWHRHNFSSTRLEYRQGFFRPIPMQTFILTPSANLLGIYYGNSPEGHHHRFLGLFSCGLEGKTSFSRTFDTCKHLVEPYFRLEYLTYPTVSPNDHYIFDIEDGWYQSKNIRLGLLNQLFVHSNTGCLVRPLFVDLYTYAFIDTPTIGSFLPKGYLTLSTLSSPTLRHTLETAWDFQHGTLDHFNFRTAWTAADNLAIQGEYRHRSPFCWRKADPTNFILDAFRSQKELLHSPVSDRRDTLLVNLFYQYNPNWALFFEARHGWNRKHESSYNEFEADLIGRLPSAWNIKLSYQHREDDDRVAVYFTIGLHKPNRAKCEAIMPCLEL